MKSRVPYFFTIIIILIAASVFFVTLYRSFYVSSSGPEVPQSSAAPEIISSTSTMPARLLIPSLSIDAKVQQVGIARSGKMGVPDNFFDVGWYKYGPVPGARGNAVIDGHLDNALGLAGVFKHLSELNPGDDIFVIDASGNKTHFKVTDKESVSYNTTSTEKIFGEGAYPTLVLITCEGTWNKTIKQYSDRLIVFSALVK